MSTPQVVKNMQEYSLWKVLDIEGKLEGLSEELLEHSYEQDGMKLVDELSESLNKLVSALIDAKELAMFQQMDEWVTGELPDNPSEEDIKEAILEWRSQAIETFLLRQRGLAIVEEDTNAANMATYLLLCEVFEAATKNFTLRAAEMVKAPAEKEK